MARPSARPDETASTAEKKERVPKPTRSANGRSRAVAAEPRRPKGQPLPRDGARTRQKILTIAGEEFAAKGYDGARVDEIVRRANVSKNLVYHYFESKDDLFQSVLEAAYARMRERQDVTALEDLDPVIGIRKLVVATFSYWREAQDFIGYLASENFLKGRHIRRSKSIRSGYPKLIQNIESLLERGKKSGVFRSDVDPVDLYISISSLGYHYLANRHTFSAIFNRDFTAAEPLERRLKHIEDVILGYLQYRPR